MRKFRLPDFDITGMWVVAVGVWFHIMAKLVRKQPEMATLLGEIICFVMVLIGGYKILNKLLADLETKEKVENEAKVKIDD
ncbi:type-F conjugative transfer system pilin chaperone TraQ [Xenorhabdus sp. XENO-1]|uniref:type-F conjugative transfer system pilin chaperone TraQ n=1 Tax=Xenorhabdus bovienii TaxID=40576 RepID=UPI0020CA7BBA|nr:type-F conjugative transfer system pilin chaperone TraQ [Xenorhabdus bovienii]MCP9269152.1 type-F conjugative transfer system pilin chaperone TraQ [Xenorhabdus bovienii subsp. africana]